MTLRFTTLISWLLLPAWLWGGRPAGAKGSAGTRWTLHLRVEMLLTEEDDLAN